jgi:hypothetical protein
MKCESRWRNIANVTGILIIVIVAAGCTTNGGNFPSVQLQQTNTGGTQPPDQIPVELDAYCEIQEFNSTRVHDYTIVPLTKEDLKPYPEFAQYFENGENNTQAWRNDGTRSVAYFDCNESAATRFYKLSRKYEEFPNQPVFEFKDHYYEVFFNSYIWHSTTAEPTIAANASGNDINETAVKIALDNGTVKSYLEHGYSLVRAGPATIGINDRSLEVMGVQFDTPQDTVGVNVDVKNESIVNIWTLPKRETEPVNGTGNRSVEGESAPVPPIATTPARV